MPKPQRPALRSASGNETTLQNGNGVILKRVGGDPGDPIAAEQVGNEFSGVVGSAGRIGKGNNPQGLDSAPAAAADLPKGSGVGEAVVEALEDAFVREPTGTAAERPGDSCCLWPAVESESGVRKVQKRMISKQRAFCMPPNFREAY